MLIKSIVLLLFVCLAHSTQFPSQHEAILRKRGVNEVIGIGGLVATVIGVVIAAIGVFGWTCWRGRRRVKKTQHNTVRDHAVEVPLRNIPPRTPLRPEPAHLNSINNTGGIHYHYYAASPPPQPSSIRTATTGPGPVMGSHDIGENPWLIYPQRVLLHPSRLADPMPVCESP
ncbi:hypothetical protein K440DRAFT_642098 [Wilcoxina mikolae CBS 423.85]|nr:hypothetical protein K440DRAFT_642098 [Wilcoxina mikolae CBS 423.85]